MRADASFDRRRWRAIWSFLLLLCSGTVVVVVWVVLGPVVLGPVGVVVLCAEHSAASMQPVIPVMSTRRTILTTSGNLLY